jgi:hypothetical protein
MKADTIKVPRKDRRTAYRDCGTMTEQSHVSQECSTNVQAHKAPEQCVCATQPACEPAVNQYQTNTREGMPARITKATQPPGMTRAEIAQEATIQLRHHNPTQERSHDAALTVRILPKVQPIQSRTTIRTDTGMPAKECAPGQRVEQAPQSKAISSASVFVGAERPSEPPTGANMGNDLGRHVLSRGVADGHIPDGSISPGPVQPRALPRDTSLRQTPQSGMTGAEGLIQGKIRHSLRAVARGNAFEAAADWQRVRSLDTRTIPLNESVNDFIGRLERETEEEHLPFTSQGCRAMTSFRSNATAEHRLLQNLPDDGMVWSSQDLPSATVQQPYETGQPDIYEEMGEDVCLAGTHDWLDEAIAQPYHELAQEGLDTVAAYSPHFFDLQEAVDTYRMHPSTPVVELGPPKAPEHWESAVQPAASSWKHSVLNRS